MPTLRTLVRSGPAGFTGLVALEHLLRPDLPPAERFISEYGRGWTQPVHGAALAAAFATQTLGGELPADVARTLGGRLHDGSADSC